MSNRPKWLGPVAIGGVGGSGTRLIAEILIQLGFYVGKDLNSANDNLWFTLLFKRPDWFLQSSRGNESHIFENLSIFEKAMTANLKPDYKELKHIIRAASKIMFKGHDYSGAGRGLWPIKRAMTLLRSKDLDTSRYLGWGWKEPNTHIYIEYLSRHFSNLKYIHLIRHGIDMAYSSNYAQLYNWGTMFGINIHNTSIPLPKLSLNYWNNANKRTITLGQQLLNKRFMLINFDRLCINPKEEIELLVSFLGIDAQRVDINTLAKLPKQPESTGRYKKYDLSIFSKDEIDAVKEMGFDVDISKGI